MGFKKILDDAKKLAKREVIPIPVPTPQVEPTPQETEEYVQEDIWELQQVPTQVAQVFVNKATGEKVGDQAAILLRILNLQEEMFKIFKS